MLSCACLAVGHAQGVDGTGTMNVYDLYQGPANLGEFGMSFAPASGTDGATEGVSTNTLEGVSSSYVTIEGFLDLSATLTVWPDGSAVDYRLAGTIQGVAIELTAEFHATGATVTATQAGQTSSFELASSEPLFVIDNNFIDGLQVLARRAVAQPGIDLDVAIIVPQVVLLGRATAVASQAAEEIEHHDGSLTVTRVEVVMTVAGQAVASTLWLDEAGDIVVLEQPVGAVRFVRRAPDADGGADLEGSADAPVLGAAAFLEAAGQCVEVSEVTVESTGEVLAGVLTLPRDEGLTASGPAPTLLVLPGSGAVDLAGNVPPIVRNSGHEQLAFALGCRGFGVLRIAKLGIPPSTGDGNAVTLDTYAQNTADWLELLAGHPGVDPYRIGVIGHSEGGVVALYAAASGLIDPAVLVLVATPGRPIDVLLEEQLLARASESGATEEQLAELRVQVDEAMAAIKSSTGTRLELSGTLAENPVAQAFSHAAGLLRSEMEQDPARLLAGLDLPILIVQGEKDLQVRTVDGLALAAAAPDAEFVLLPDLTHNLVDVPGAAQDGLVPAPDAVISDGLLLAVGTFLDEHLGSDH